MKNALIPNEKQLIKGIVSAFNRMESTKKDYVLSVISLGERLLEAKEKVPHGQWENYCKNDLKSALGGRISSTRQASKYMQIAEQKTLVLEYFSDENSVNQLTKAIADATPEQLERIKQIEAERIAAEEKAAADRAAKADENEIIEGEFKEVKAKPSKPAEKQEELKAGFIQIEAEKMEEIEDSLHELASLNKSISKDNDSMIKVFDANDQLSAAVKEIKRLNELNTSLEGRLHGFMNERNALIREAKYWRARAEKLEKANVK